MHEEEMDEWIEIKALSICLSNVGPKSQIFNC